MFRKLFLSLFLPFLFIVSDVFADQQKLTAFELNRKLLSFSDNYQESISETIDEIISDGVDSTSRMIYQTIKVFYTSSAIDIATESDALHQLMDMLIMVRLQRIIWDNGGHDLSKPEHAKRFAERLNKLEENLHYVGIQVFSQTDIDRIMLLAEKWKKEHPDREYIAFVRFQDFAHSETKVQLEETITKGGLFSSISETNKEIEETRFAVERAMFIANHFPILAEWQAELFLYKMLSTDEVRTLLSNGEALKGTSEKLINILENLPANVSTELQKTLDLNHEPIKKITSDLAMTSENLKHFSDNLSPLISEEDGNQLNLIKIQEIVNETKIISSDLILLTEKLSELNIDENAAMNLSGLLSENINSIDKVMTQQRDTVNQMVYEQQNRFGIIVAGLILLFFICFLVSMLIIQKKK